MMPVRLVSIHPRPCMAVRVFIEFRHEHWWEIDQAILTLRVGEVIAVPIRPQLVRHLVDDEGGMWLRTQRSVGIREDLPLFILLENAERYPRHYVVAMR